MEKHKKFKNFFIKNIFAVMVGFVNGFFGGGGGLICVPTLEKVYKLDTKTAHATTVSIMLPLSIISSIIYIVHSKMNIFNTLAVTIGSVIGGLIGAFALKKSNSKFSWRFAVASL